MFCNATSCGGFFFLFHFFTASKMLSSCFVFYNFLAFTFSFNIDIDNAIVYKLPGNGERRSYFGTSVAIRPIAANLNGSEWVIQIGAPRSNTSMKGVVEPGAIFRCRVGGKCFLQNLDNKGNEYHQKMIAGKRFYSLRKDNGWVGGAMDIRNYPGGEIAIICGHRLSYQAVNLPDKYRKASYLYIGGCYLEQLDKPDFIQLLLPLKKEDRAYYDISFYGIDYDWGKGLAGMAVSLDSNGLLLGAPHVRYMTGTILKYSRTWSQPLVAQIPAVKRITKDYIAYNGYSVGSGNFFGDGKEWHVFGAPRSNDLRGHVYAAQFTNFETLVLHPSELQGETIGEYFGSSLHVGNLNGDQYDDLVVGAPTYSDDLVDQGRIYIYYGSKSGFKQNIIRNGNVENGRFGTSVSVAGDLNQDGFNDLIVGAPYDNKAGAVFIYRGGADGIAPHPSQVIYASQIDNNLRGFGISISRAVDVDKNNYPDFLVGAYQSDQAVLLRSRQVISLDPRIQAPQFLDRKGANFKISICFAYATKHAGVPIFVDATLVIDENFGRATFDETSSQMLHLEKIKTFYTKPTCKSISITFDMERLPATFDNSVEISLECSLYQNPAKAVPKVVWNDEIKIAPLEPIIINDEVSKTKRIETSIPFAGECGLDNICNTHLKLKCDMEASMENGYYKYQLGYSENINIVVAVENLEEPAYHTQLIVTQNGVSYDNIMSLNAPCNFDNPFINCSLGKIDDKSQKLFVFQVDTKNWAWAAAPLVQFSFNVSSSSRQTQLADTYCNLKLLMSCIAETDLLASPSDPSISTTAHQENLPTINFTHMYEAKKSGKSPIKGKITVFIPNTVYGAIKFANLDTDGEEQFQKGHLLNEWTPDDTIKSSQVKTEISSFNGDHTYSSDRTLYLNCSSEDVDCIPYTMDFEATSSTWSKSLDFPMQFNVSALGEILKDIEVIHFTTSGYIETKDCFGLKLNSTKTTTTSIILTKAPASVEIRTIVLSAIAGGLVLALIFPILVKNGFFKRKVKEQMDALKVLDFMYEQFDIDDQDASSRISVSTL